MAITKAQFIDAANQRYIEAHDFWRNWRIEALDDYAFISGNQWMPEDEALLIEQKRPPITFNYSEKMIDAVVGAEVSNRQEVRYNPRQMEAAPVAELWTNAAKWCRDECNAEDEETDAFRDMLITGMGWTQTRMSYDEDLEGKVVIECVDVMEMFADPAARKVGLTDRRYNFRLWWVDEKQVKAEWPNAIVGQEDLDANGAVITRGHRYEDDSYDERERHKGQVQLRHYECVEKEIVYRIADPQGIQELDEKTFGKFKSKLDELGIQYVKQYKRIYYRGFFANDTLLEWSKSPCQSGFSYNCITGKRDHNRNTWYGLTRVMKDPQRWANKWLSQILHIINSNAKGGIMAEINAFVDPRKAQDEWAQPDSITLFKEGAISGQKVMARPQAGYPAGLDKLMTFALGSLPMVTGINLEALGLANREQAGVLEQQRKQAAYGLLAPLFDGLRRYRKVQGKVFLYYIHEYISDGRLVRIGGPESQQYLPLTKPEGTIEYDIIIDDSPTAPDVKEKTWETLQSILPAMLKAGLPLPPDLLDFTPLPTGLIVKWKQFAAQQQQPNPQMQQMQQALQQLQQENQQLKADQQTEMLGLQQKAQQQQAELQIKAQHAQAESKLRRDVAESDFQLEVYKQQQQFELEQRALLHDTHMKQQQVEGDLRVKAFTAGVSATKDEKTGKGNLAIAVDMAPLANVLQQVATTMQKVAQDSNLAVKQLSTAVEDSSRERKAAVSQLLNSKPRLN